MFRRFMIALAVFIALPASANWGRVSGAQIPRGSTQSVIQHTWTTVSDSTPYSIAACLGGVEARFDPSISDSSEDARVEFRLCKNSTDTWQFCRGAEFVGPKDGTTWSGLNAVTQGENYVLAHPIAATTGGDVAKAEVRCTTAATEIISTDKADADGDSLYESAYLWDADGDGSTWTYCTGDATPDIGCKAVGEVLYRDTIDDINCAVHGCGFGQMENNGTLILGNGVFVGWPCWTPTGTNTPEAHETNDDAHDAEADAAFLTCPVDGDGERLYVLSFQDWQGTLLGSGADTRLLERGSMSATLRRDIGTYFVNDMGPWDATKNNNVWFGSGDNSRMISTGFANAYNTNHPTGANVTDNASSKGWWAVYADVDFTTYLDGAAMICLRHSGGTVNTDYKTASTVSNLRAGDVLVLPAKPYSGGSYNTYEVVVRNTPSTTCGTSNLGLRVNIGGTAIDRTSQTTTTFPPHSAVITASNNVIVHHARSGYDNTRVTIANMRIEPMDPWNEFGGRCTSSGTAWKTTVNSTGTAFLTTTDDTNTDMSCDTLPFFGLYGGGQVLIQDVVMSNFHKFAIDAGGTGYANIERVTAIYGNGGEISDSSNGWRFHDIFVDQSYFVTSIVAFFGTAPQIDTMTIRNSTFNNVVALDGQAEKARITNIRNEGNSFSNTIRVNCGAKQSVVRDVFQTSRDISALSGTPSAVYIECDDTANLVTQNTFENITLDGPDVGQSGDTVPVVVFNVPAASGSSADAQWAAIQGNRFIGINSTGYVGGTAGNSSCLFGVAEADADSPADDDGESVIFTKNYFSASSVESNGRVFCMTNTGTSNIDTTPIDSQVGDVSGSATPAWGDPVGCGNFDGPVVWADENCQ